MPPVPQPVPGEPYQTTALPPAVIEQSAAAYNALVVAPWLQVVRDTVLPAHGPTDPYGVLSGTAYWLRGVRDFMREQVWPWIRAPWQSLFGVYFDNSDPWLRNYTFTVENYLTRTPFEVYAKIRTLVQDATAAGTPLRQVAEQIDTTFLQADAPWWATRGMVVARTETRRGQMGGLWHAYTDFGDRHRISYIKRWLDSDDARVRLAHEDTDGQTRPLGLPFAVGVTGGPKYPAMYPLDPILPPELSIQCRCDMLFEEVGEAPTLMTDRRFVSGGRR